MLTRIINFSIKNKLIIGLFTIALIITGIYQATKLPIDAVPDITDNQVQVITIAPSYGATDIERLVTFPIEMANSNINGIKEIRSFSRFGLSLVTIVFKDNIDVYWARQQVSERLLQVQNEIPKDIGVPELGPISTGLGEIYQYVIRPKKGFESKYDATELRTIQDWIVRRQLLGVKGVAEVSSFGGKLKQYQVQVNTNQLNAYNLTITDIYDALELNNQNTGGAYIEKGPTVLYIRSEGLIKDKSDIENITIPNHSGRPVYLRDVATVTTGAATRYGAMTYNDKGEVAGAVVMMLKGGNSNEVIKNIKERIDQIQSTLPEGVVIEPFLDRTKMVKNAITTVETNLVEGALIVVFILVLFLGNLRAGLLVASVIPLSLLFAFIMMNLFGVSGNLMSLGALDFGLIVDGAVIIVEAVLHQLASKKIFDNKPVLTQSKMNEQVGNAASKMMNSAVFGQIIILIVYLPILSLQGIEGKMFKPMAQTVAFALLGAFLLSLTYIPMMSSIVLSKKQKTKPTISDRVMDKLTAIYQTTLQKVIHFPKIVLSIVIVLFLSALFILSRMGGEFIPSLEEGDFAVDTRVLTGSNINTTIEHTQKVVKILIDSFPEVEKVVTKIGSGEVPTDPMPMEASDMMVILKPKKEWTSAKTFPDLADKMSEKISVVPGVTAGFQYPVQMRFNELMTGARQDVVCKIFGENLDTLAKYADQLGKVINTIDGTQNLYVEPITGLPQIIIDYNRDAIARYGMNITDINRTINAGFAGQSAGLVFEDEKRFDLVVKLENNARENLEDVQNLLIPTADGMQIPLQQVADVSIQDGPNQIQREDAKRRIVVGFNVGDRDVQSIVEELQQKVEQKIDLPTGYFINYGGSFENLIEAKQRLSIAVPIALLMIFILLYFAFNSIKQGLLIFTAIPLSAIGGIYFLALRGMPFSISAGIGFIALFGVAVLNGIVMVSEFNAIRKRGELESMTDIVIAGAMNRLRPILMTAFVASLGFLPMALSNGSGAEVQRPLATVVIGGLLIATFLTLFVLPILYIMFEKINIRRKKKTIPTAIILLLISFALPKSIFAQSTISLDEAIQMALTNNNQVKNQELLSTYYQQRSQQAYALPKTGFQAELGQNNGALFDNRLTISQGFELPKVYKANRGLWQAEAEKVALGVAVQKQALQKQVALVYLDILQLEMRKNILQNLDSLYAEFMSKAQLRFEKGESDILEKTTASSQRNNLQVQVKNIDLAISNDLLLFQLLLNTDVEYHPQIVDNFDWDIANNNFSNHPVLLQMEQEMKINEATIKAEKANLLPDFNLSYTNQSFRGTGPDEVYYNGMARFNSIGIGVNVPIFNKATKNKIALAKQYNEVSQQQYATAQQQLENDFAIAFNNYKTTKETVAYLENESLPNANTIWETANIQFYNGAINYLEWVMLTNQSVQLQLQYLDALENYYKAIATLYYYQINN